MGNSIFRTGLDQRSVPSANERGELFGFHTRTDIGGSDVIEFSMLVPTTKKIEALPTIIVTNTELAVDFYQDVTLTGGVDITSQIRCMNQYNPNNTVVQEVLSGPVISDYGELNYPDYIPATNFYSGVSEAGTHWFLKPGVRYSVKIENLETTSGIFKFSLFWIEHHL